MSDISISTIHNDKNAEALFYHDKCDKYDYLFAAGCGVIAGLTDIFLVGTPKDSKLRQLTDAQTDSLVMLFAKTCGWTPKAGKENNAAGAIGFLEKKFVVNYDQRHSGDVDGLFSMSAKNHHMKSLAHSPDIIGLFFSILNQFTSTSSFLSDGQLITIQTETFELHGNDLASKMFCGAVNWFGHLMSDFAGSSGAVGRGSGIVIPFYELFQLCDFGSFKVGQYRNTLATLATKVFQNGYDARFGLAMTIPVVICDLCVKFVWAVKRYFCHNEPLEECIPLKRHDDLRIMLLIADGTLCLMDGADAVVRSRGNCFNFFLRMNLIAWYRLILLVFREICIRLGIAYPLQKQLDAYIRINEALSLYLSKLEQIDYELFRKETERYNDLIRMTSDAKSEEELNEMLRMEYKSLGIQLPYKESIDDFMHDPSSVLVFN